MSTRIGIYTKVTVEKGCKALLISKGARATVTQIQELGADYSHQVKVTLRFSDGKERVLYAQHPNRLANNLVALRGVMPSHRVDVRVVRASRGR